APFLHCQYRSIDLRRRRLYSRPLGPQTTSLFSGSPVAGAINPGPYPLKRRLFQRCAAPARRFKTFCIRLRTAYLGFAPLRPGPISTFCAVGILRSPRGFYSGSSIAIGI
ncbi:hypothetical protein DFH09DRAFT_1025947, partial [Mycena vulgaris]